MRKARSIIPSFGPNPAGRWKKNVFPQKKKRIPAALKHIKYASCDLKDENSAVTKKKKKIQKPSKNKQSNI